MPGFSHPTTLLGSGLSSLPPGARPGQRAARLCRRGRERRPFLTFAGKRTRISKGQTAATAVCGHLATLRSSGCMARNDRNHGHVYPSFVAAGEPAAQHCVEMLPAMPLADCWHGRLGNRWLPAVPSKQRLATKGSAGRQRGCTGCSGNRYAPGPGKVKCWHRERRHSPGNWPRPYPREQPRKGTPPRQKRRQGLADCFLPPDAGKIRCDSRVGPATSGVFSL
jgi:hypothetical protein